MPFDFAPCPDPSLAGRQAYEDGLAAEDIVRRDYLARGYRFVAARWRGQCGEIDLIFQTDAEHVFVEVKMARTLDIAATRLSERQLWRIAHAAEDYLANICATPFRPMRLDLAMVDGQGQMSVLENLTLF